MNKLIRGSFVIFAFLILCIFIMNVSLAEDKKEVPAAKAAAPAPSAIPNQNQVVSSAPAVNPEGAKENAPAPKEEAKETQEEAAPLEPGNVTVNFKGADIRTVLAYISEVSGVDIVPSPG